MSQNINKKYRPRKFAEVLGQPIAVNSIRTSIMSGVLPPAYLLYGIQGGGKTTLARLIAMSVNCTQRNGAEPCGECPACASILEGTSDYLIEIDGASHGKIDNVRELQEALQFVVSDEHKKVIIIDECHELTKQAWDALLKTLEEPPPNVMFVLCTTDFVSIKPTIKSRCVKLQLLGVQDSVIIDRLKKLTAAEGAKADDGALELMAKHARGSIRDAQSILEGFIRSGAITSDMVKSLYPTLDSNVLFSYFNKVMAKDMKGTSVMSMGWMRSGFTPQIIITQLVEHVQNMLMDFKVENPGLKTLYKNQRDKAGDDRILEWLDILDDRLRFVKDHPTYYTLLIDSIAIRLINTMQHTVRTKAKATKEANAAISGISEAVVPSKETGNINAVKVDTVKADIFKRACKGSIVVFDPNLNRVTIKNQKGTVLDIVSSPEYAVSPIYILASNLDIAIKDYPNNMKDVAVKRT